MEHLLALGIGSGAGLAAVAALVLFSGQLRLGRATPLRSPDRIEFFLQDGVVVDLTPDARQLSETARQTVETWDDLCALFAQRFPDMPAAPPDTQILCRALDDPGTFLRIAPARGMTRVALECTPPKAGDLHIRSLRSTELQLLRSAMVAAPSPIWQSDRAGTVFWHNAAYRTLCARLHRDPDDSSPFDVTLPENGETHTMRISVEDDAGNKLWFEVTTKRNKDRWLHFAVDIDAIVTAEIAQRNFLQTLTKTFAHLPTGLAVFDRDRRLVLFNPALIDLTALPADFLSNRPNLASFFDHMRENRMMPEPKDYKSWREHMADLTDAARHDRYSETWNLPSGLTYKITGRPHPDGAVAFLLEDISAEISLTRRFRSELELSQSVLDAFDDAVAVFSQLGVLTFCNAAYRDLWGCDPDSAFAEMSILDTTRQWQQRCEPSPVWPDLREFVLNIRDRAGWEAELQMRDGTDLTCFVEPVIAGATMVRFQHNARSTRPAQLMIADAGE
ncbi:PAS-domain containing protein [Aestuariicoccus sp. MJ-SS9]|uniref:PAS-domain containing protein n=1 Tax=Aestuariicoccus sp. MJ-SS9 TaxID=3079855 RepID=UPI00290C4D0D|nr:PAS-domain containing protein [Aestuariicoccus sp. MJ-SS9]MDU8910853.1 PAS-domain containing protein [Aestuariicoccus sp. MJ-SS9]